MDSDFICQFLFWQEDEEQTASENRGNYWKDIWRDLFGKHGRDEDEDRYSD
ncbi:hypothetical protein [Paenibacillus qinlingensis]|uniref:hypothetical protein n=1 Tax=Paenibacillus qinlingensis TaxID=1837343 RepID=UPI001566C71B|nr:hypothetical protein [Paenibacillus qinlingensis]NQX62693.1 hypothetical protein [Paenibacillus qinlingensis]